MELSSLDLARMQFAANITFHILFPTISIGLGWVMFYLRFQHVRTGKTEWEQAHYFWTKIFALTFALGVVSGITMSFQFGTNWPGFMEKAGNIAGPLLGYEVLTAFFLEATFLGVMLFGKQRVSPKVHLLATFLVAFGTTLSAFWILVLNSWMQTPQGFEVINGELHPTDWLAIVFNPSFPYRLAHMLMASALTVFFLIAGGSALQILRRKEKPFTRSMLKLAVTGAAVVIPIQIVVGDLHGLNTLHHQPAKIAAIEAVWHTERGAPLVLFAIPDKEKQENRFAIEIPKLASLILTHDPNGEIKGLNEFVGEHPPVAVVFYSFRVMVGMGSLMLLVSWLAVWLFRKNGPVLDKPLHRLMLKGLLLMMFSGWLATVAGWWVTEIGRQPYVVYGVLSTADVVAQHPPQLLAFTVALYLALYLGLIAAYVWVLRYMLLGGTGSAKPVVWGGGGVPGSAPADRIRRIQP
ncbi:cytochrome ubiquinol oxidase subunit I [Limnobacter humi]|uniref:Cytochrome ubiquinol oxidase subunit I n=1 Tax=Limnobacter humi TaxID=1778671 RepID=A0ABT1WHM1_9BURK|nr:cytochrome ubiquinol oxidase subunit I [Limnobacter humi]MCQ8896909.1 cytochrome ubiquinol oxidase subunit I [Limnobacter humi]